MNFNQLPPSTSAKRWREVITVDRVLTWLRCGRLLLLSRFKAAGWCWALCKHFLYIYIHKHLYPHNNLETGALLNSTSQVKKPRLRETHHLVKVT